MTDRYEQTPTEQRVTELLPWYVNGTLNDEERRLVQQYLQTNLTCRKEYDALKALGKAIRDSESRTPARRSLADLMTRIDAYENESRGNRRPWRWLRERLAAMAGRWANVEPVAQRLLVAQAAVILVVGVTLGTFWATTKAPPVARTLTDAAQTAPATGDRFRVVLREETSEVEVRQLLRSLSAQIVGGPSASGVYTIALEAGADAEASLETLRAHPAVRFAEHQLIGVERGR